MKITNKRAYFDYELLERIEAGINLYGHEVKSLRLGKGDLSGSYVKIIGNEAYLVNAKIFPYQAANIANFDERRTRKLLIHKSQIIALKSRIEGANNLSLVPVSFYFKHGFVKLEVAIGKGKKKFEKREAIKRKDIQRQIEQEGTL